jgi:hypothetical protein
MLEWDCYCVCVTVEIGSPFYDFNSSESPLTLKTTGPMLVIDPIVKFTVLVTLNWIKDIPDSLCKK